MINHMYIQRHAPRINTVINCTLPIVGVSLPVGDVELGDAGEQELEVARVEPAGHQQFGLKQLVERAEQRLRLALHRVSVPPASHCLDVHLLVLLSHRRIPPIRPACAINDFTYRTYSTYKRLQIKLDFVFT